MGCPHNVRIRLDGSCGRFDGNTGAQERTMAKATKGIKYFIAYDIEGDEGAGSAVMR